VPSLRELEGKIARSRTKIDDSPALGRIEQCKEIACGHPFLARFIIERRRASRVEAMRLFCAKSIVD